MEAHAHGGVRFTEQAAAVVLDPCFAGTVVEAAAQRLGCAIEWHPGFRVRVADIDPDYRGPEIVALARRIGAELNPAVVGAAARSGRHDPQDLKKVWHCLARYGRPTSRNSAQVRRW
ncbi:DUF3626 domain-containing protein [Nocardioides sp. BGMRC 2183]|nr:DUF3626 domain-containing protein [Nocardioides sp. BGMRC 2183]